MLLSGDLDGSHTAPGITRFSDLTAVQVTRKQAISASGDRIRSKLYFLNLIKQADESRRIRLFDGDMVSVGKSDVVLR